MYFWLVLVSAKKNICKPEPGNDFCDVKFKTITLYSSSPRSTVQGVRCEELSSFFLSWNLIGQRETRVFTSKKMFPGSDLQTSFSAEASNRWTYARGCRLFLGCTSATAGVS